MSAFGLNPGQEEMKSAAIAFARKHLNYDAAAADRAGTFPREAWKACAEFGLQGLPIAEEFGGRGASPLTTIAVMEGIGYACRDRGLLFSINAQLWSVTLPISLWGTPEQKKRYLPGLCDGSLIGANAASEPDAGSDIFSIRTRAIRHGDAYILNGAKTFVSNGPVADLFLAYATLDPAKGVLGICSFIVDRQTPGITVSGVIDKMGLRTSPMAQLALDDVRIPDANCVGRVGRGAEVFNSSMEWERGCILASCLGGMQRQLEECIAHARQRKQFGQPIGKNQSVANRIVAMKLRLETARPLVYQFGSLKEQGRNAEMEAAMAKLWVSEAFVESCLDAIQIHGGYGFTTALPYEQELRDSVGATLYSGTSDIQRRIIAGKLGL